jgi:hypothetical protein
MVERVKLDPTMEEIVVALRETKRGAGRAPPFIVVGGRSEGNWAPDATHSGGDRVRDRATVADAQNQAGSTAVADLRDWEIDRLLTENARLNERVMFLVKVIEREQAGSVERAAEHAAIATDHGVIFRDVRAALETELRPILLVLLRMLEKRRTEPVETGNPLGTPLGTPVGTPVDTPVGTPVGGPEAARLARPDLAEPLTTQSDSSPDVESGSSPDVDGKDAASARPKAIAAGILPPQPDFRQRMARVDRYAARLISFSQGRHLQTSVDWWRRRVGWPA